MVRRALAVVGLLAVASCTQAPPSGYGVDLTMTLNGTFKSSVTSVVLAVSGAETFTATLNGSAFPSGTGHIHYVPGVKSGVLTFSALALEGTKPVGNGATTVTLVPSKAVMATIVVNAGSPPDMAGPDLGPPCPCMGGQFCDATNHCQPLKQAGDACGGSLECFPGLTCLDGVCCTVAVCPQCANCAPMTGMCTVPVVSAPDTTGNACMGANTCDATSACKLALGQTCTMDTACASGHCVDGVCCGVATCPQCMNCGATGACDVQVKSADDNSGTTCTGNSSCDANGMCKLRWQMVSMVTLPTSSTYGLFVSALGNKVYFADECGQDAGTNAAQFFKSYDVSTNMLADETKTNNTMCACGYSDYLLPANGSLYYFGNPTLNPSNNGQQYTGSGPWLTVPNFSTAANGEAAEAAIGTKIYRVGGRSGPVVQSYDTVAQTWVTSGLTNAPIGVSSACAGAYNGKLYVFGGNSKQVIVYDPAGNAWTTLPASANEPTNVSCYLQYGWLWRNKITFSDGQLEQFDPAAQTWLPSLSLPSISGVMGIQWVVALAGSAPDLYLVGYATNTTTAYIYKWIFN